MEIPSYTSNIQPYGSQSGTKIATESETAKSVSTRQDETSHTNKLVEQEKQQAAAEKAAVKQVEERDRLSEEQKSKLMEQMNQFVSSLNKGLSFRVDEESGRDIVTIYDTDTGDVIRQIPEEEILEVIRRLDKEREHRIGNLLMTKV
jgi:flagellar protein FlaG